MRKKRVHTSQFAKRFILRTVEVHRTGPPHFHLLVVMLILIVHGHTNHLGQHVSACSPRVGVCPGSKIIQTPTNIPNISLVSSLSPILRLFPDPHPAWELRLQYGLRVTGQARTDAQPVNVGSTLTRSKHRPPRDSMLTCSLRRVLMSLEPGLTPKPGWCARTMDLSMAHRRLLATTPESVASSSRSESSPR